MLWILAPILAHASSENAPPAPLVIPASQYLYGYNTQPLALGCLPPSADLRYSEGNNGPWSTFDIRVGTPEQDIRVLVSTASPFSLVPFGQQACSTSVFRAVPPDCAVSRGNLFNHNQSSTWHDTGLYGTNQNGVGLEANLGYQARVQFGLDRLAIGLTGPGLDNQTVGGIAAPGPFYLYVYSCVLELDRPLSAHQGYLGDQPAATQLQLVG